MRKGQVKNPFCTFTSVPFLPSTSSHLIVKGAFLSLIFIFSSWWEFFNKWNFYFIFCQEQILWKWSSIRGLNKRYKDTTNSIYLFTNILTILKKKILQLKSFIIFLKFFSQDRCHQVQPIAVYPMSIVQVVVMVSQFVVMKSKHD